MISIWRVYLFRRLLAACDLNREFISRGHSRDFRKAMFHALPRQMFIQVEQETADAYKRFMDASRPSDAELLEAHRLFVNFFEQTLNAGTISHLAVK